MRWFLVLWLLVLPAVAFADPPQLDAASEAYDTGDYALTIELSEQVLSEDVSKRTKLDARELIALAQFEEGRAGQQFLDELRALEREISVFSGEDSLDRLDMLNLISATEYNLGGDANRLTDVQIVRIARLHQDATEDLLFALRNIAVDYSNQDDAAIAAQFAALYEFFATDLLGYGDPVSMEATAFTALELIRADAPVRGVQKFATYPVEQWLRFADIGPYEAELADELADAVNATMARGTSVDWVTQVNEMTDHAHMLAALAEQIGEWQAAGAFSQALMGMDSYLAQAFPEDALAAIFLNVLMKHYLDQGQFAEARPYIGGVLSYPATYAAALDMPVANIAVTVARDGGIEDVLLEALLLKGQDIEGILRRPDPELRVNLSYQLGQLKARTNDPEAALLAFENTLNLLEAGGGAAPSLMKETLYGAAIASTALGRTELALSYLTQFKESAEQSNDTDALTTALGELALASLQAGRKSDALIYSRQKLALEKARPTQDIVAIKLAQMNLAVVLFQQTDLSSPDLTQLLIEIFDGEIEDAALRDIRVFLFRAISNRLGRTAEELSANPVFLTLSSALRAEVVSGLAELAFDAGETGKAKGLLALGYETANEQSDAFFSLKLIEGRIAQSEGRLNSALLAFRAVTDHRIQPGIRPSSGALSHLPYHLSASFDLALDPNSGQDLRFQNEMFQIAQWASTTVAGGALNDAIARSQADGAIEGLLREKQVLTRELSVLNSAISRASYDGLRPDDIIARLTQTEARHAELNRQINLASPTLASLSGFHPLRMEDVANTLREDELIVMFTSSDVTPAGDRAGSFAIALGHEDIFVGALPTREELITLSHSLRCSAALTDPNCAAQGDGQTRGSFSMAPKAPALGPVFDTRLAHEAYNVLFAPFSVLLQQKKRLIIVADQALVSLPYHLMLQDPLEPSQPLSEGNWLIRDHSIEVIPSVSSFVALRSTAGQIDKPKRFLGVGDPLIGVQRLGAIPFNCGDTETPVLTASLDADALKRGLGSDRTLAVANLQALPDTRCELRQIARQFGEQSTLLLHGEASEVELKALSEAGELRDYSVISFATHGLVAGEVGVNESGLVLSPPDLPTLRDDGLLTTHEIAALDLDAEFVILSACNTASGDTENAEGLSGMASAFFFAGARSLLVSHWPVYSDAAVDLTTRSFGALQSDSAMARADAVRLAMLAILDDPNATPRQQHPSYWGPFMVVGDGLGL